MSILNLNRLFRIHEGSIQNAIASLGDITQYTEIETKLHNTPEKRKNLGEFGVGIVCHILNNPNHKLEKINLSGGTFKAPYQKIRELAEAVANSTNPPQVLIKKTGKDLYETLTQFLTLNQKRFDFSIVKRISNAGVDVGIGQYNAKYKTTALTTSSIIRSAKNFNTKTQLLQQLKELGVDMNVGVIYSNGNKRSLASSIILNHPNDFINKLKEIKKLGVDMNVGMIYPNGNIGSLASSIIQDFPDNFQNKLLKIGEIGINVLTSGVRLNGNVLPINKELSLSGGAKLEKNGVKYFATKQLINAPTRIRVDNSDVLFKTADGKSYSKLDFNNLDQDITPLKELVKSGLPEQYGFKVQDILSRETLEKIRMNFVPFLKKYYKGEYDSIDPEITGMIGNNFLPQGSPTIFVDGAFNPELLKLIPSIDKKQNVIRLEISKLYDEIEKLYKENIDGDDLSKFNSIPDLTLVKHRNRLKIQFIDHVLIETSGCELTLGKEQFNQALAIAKENNYDLSLDLAKKLATAFMQNPQQNVIPMLVDINPDFNSKAISTYKPSKVREFAKEMMYPLLSKEKYQKLSLLQRLKRDTRETLQIINVKKSWLDKLEGSLGEGEILIHKEKLLHELKNLPKEQLEPLLGFGMKSAANLAEFINEHSARNSEIMQQALVAQPSGDNRKRAAARALQGNTNTAKRARIQGG